MLRVTKNKSHIYRKYIKTYFISDN